jgi:predicted Zn-dependent protease
LCLAAVLQGSCAPVLAQVRLPSMGESVSAGMPLGAERRLGDQIWVEVRRDASYLDDPVLGSYLQSLWQPLVQAAQRKGEIGDDMATQFAWRAFLIRDRSINAFALPGGYVGIHLGLMAATSNRDELVSVVAHELAHVTQRHIARSLDASGRQSALGITAMLLGLIIAARSGNADAAQAAVTAGQAAMLQGQLNFSRDMEREADRMGQSLMAEAGFRPSGMSSMFDKLDKANRLNDSGQFPYLRSHPLTSERVAEAQLRAGIDGPRPAPALDAEHELMRARARVLMDTGIAALQQQAAAAASSTGPGTGMEPGKALPAALVYAQALAAVQLKDTRGLQQAFERWTSQPVPADPVVQRWMQLLWVEAELALPGALAGLPEAQRWLAVRGEPVRWDRPELALFGRWLLSRSAAQPAIRELQQALRSWLVRHPADAPLWELLSQVEAARGNRLAMLRATAEAQLASGRADTAMVTLQAARQGARQMPDADAVELAVIDARLAELRRLQREARAERESRGGRGPERGSERDAPDLRDRRATP